MINNKEDLYNTYIKNDNGELLRLYVEKCLSFGFVLSPAFSGKKLLDESFNYAVLGIDGDCVWAVSMNHREMKRELTLEDLTPQTNIEAPEEKEAFDLIDATPRQYESVASKEVEWNSGDKCVYNGDEFLFVGMIPTLNDFSCVIFSDTHGAKRATTIELSKPETEAERIEREREESAKDLYITYMSKWEFAQDWCALDEINKSAFLAIVDKTNYRKESE